MAGNRSETELTEYSNQQKHCCTYSQSEQMGRLETEDVKLRHLFYFFLSSHRSQIDKLETELTRRFALYFDNV
jgi:hypothetical protein